MIINYHGRAIQVDDKLAELFTQIHGYKIDEADIAAYLSGEYHEDFDKEPEKLEKLSDFMITSTVMKWLKSDLEVG